MKDKTTIFLQGRDFKAKKWAEHFGDDVVFFSKLSEYWAVLCRFRKGDSIVFRYQNNAASLTTTIATTATLGVLILVARLKGVHVFWICHNVDRETSSHWPMLAGVRRSLLLACARSVFVLHPLFKTYLKRECTAISFGEKEFGVMQDDTLAEIDEFGKSFDTVVLMAGTDGVKKNTTFDRIPELANDLIVAGKNPGFVLAGVSPLREFPEYLKHRICISREKNISEDRLKPTISFVYKELSDISIGYTIYAAATAKIPIISLAGSVLERVVQCEKVGLSLQDWLEGRNIPTDEDFESFLNRNRWDSLAREMESHGVWSASRD